MQYFDYIISHYGWQGASLAAAALVLFFVQLYYYVGVYGRISSFRNSRRKKILTSEPPLSVIVPIFSEDYSYLDRLPQLLAQQYAEAKAVAVSAVFGLVLATVTASGIPEAIAAAVQKIDFTQPYDSRTVIRELDEKFVKALKQLLEKGY